MKTKQDRHRITMGSVKTFAFVLLLSLAGCGGQDEPTAGEKPDESDVEKPGDIQLSDTEIRLEVADWKPLQESRAVLFDQENFLEGNEANTLPGGNFTLNAYTSDGQTFLEGARGWYFADTDKPEWRFRSDIDGTVTFPTYYWPNSGTVDFFAYMPYKGYVGAYEDYVTIDDDEWSFSCNLPGNNTKDDKQIEFIYAYEKDMTKANNPLELHFKHPFAAVYFKLSPNSSRMTVNSITLQKLYLNGKFSVKTGSWSSEGEELSNYEANIGKRIPNDINYNTIFGGPFIVMPQPLSNQVRLALNATRLVDDSESGTSTAIDANVGLTGEWLPGKKYIYTLEVGNKNEEIYFNVQVVDWIPVDYRNDINVE